MAARKWSAAQREQQRKAIQQWKPWEQSSGPVSEQGKRKSSRNAATGPVASDERIALKELNMLLKEFRQRCRA